MTGTPLRTDGGIDVRQAVEEYQGMVYGIALSRVGNQFDADDIFQEVFLIYFKKGLTFRDEQHRKAWLIKTTLNCCKRLVFNSWRKKTEPLDASRGLSYNFVSREENLIFTALRELPVKYRTVLHLFYIEEFKTEEIAGALGISGAAVRTRLKRGRDMLREKLKGEYDFE